MSSWKNEFVSKVIVTPIITEIYPLDGSVMIIDTTKACVLNIDYIVFEDDGSIMKMSISACIFYWFILNKYLNTEYPIFKRKLRLLLTHN